MVWDDDGAVATTTQFVSATPGPQDNPFVDPDFAGAGPFAGQSYNIWSGRRGEGWIARDVRRNPAGFAEVDAPQFGLGELGQIIRDQNVRRGQQTFSFDVRNMATAGAPEQLRVRLYGVDGQWELAGGVPGPVAAMPAPNVATLLDIELGPSDIVDWQTQAQSVDLGTAGFEYLVIYINYFGYNYSQGDYFSFDNFSLSGSAQSSAANATVDEAARDYVFLAMEVEQRRQRESRTERYLQARFFGNSSGW